MVFGTLIHITDIQPLDQSVLRYDIVSNTSQIKFQLDYLFSDKKWKIKEDGVSLIEIPFTDSISNMTMYIDRSSLNVMLRI